jgi:predicted DNA binding CopG/RHH family protein
LNDAIDHKDKLITHHYQGKISAELKADHAISENEALKLATQQLEEQLQEALMTEQRQNSTSTSTASTLKKPAELLNALKGKLPKSKTSLRDVEVILDYLESLKY